MNSQVPLESSLANRNEVMAEKKQETKLERLMKIILAYTCCWSSVKTKISALTAGGDKDVM